MVTTPDYAGLFSALTSYQQADEDGVMVLVSRQACDEAATALRTLLERSAALEREIVERVNHWSELYSKEHHRAEAAEARLAEARKALEPFAMVAEHDISEDETDSDAFRPMPKPFNHAPQITVGHLRAARKFLKENGGRDAE